MNCKKIATRALSMLLCLIMIAGIIPVSVSAAADPIKFSGTQFTGGKNGYDSDLTVTSVAATADAPAHVHFSSAASDDSYSPSITINATGLQDTPYMKVYYRTSGVTVTPNSMEFTWLNANDVETWPWEVATDPTDGEGTSIDGWSYYIKDLSDVTDGPNTWANCYKNTKMVGFGKGYWFKAANVDATAATPYTIDIAAIEFYDSVANAKAADLTPAATVKFMAENGTDVYVTDYVWKTGEKIALPATNPTSTDTAKTFIGWYTQANGQGDAITADTVVNADVTAYPYFAESYAISFDIGTGTPIVKNIPKSMPLELPADAEIPTMRGYEFDGWYTSNDETGVKITNEDGTIKADYATVTASVAYFAKYILTGDAEDIKVVYMLDTEGDSAYAVATFTTHDEIELLTEGPAKVGYTFDAWDLANAEGVAETVTPADGDIIATFIADDADQIVIRPTFSVSGTSYVAPAGIDATPEYLYFTVEAGSLAVNNYGTYSSTRVNDADGLDYIRVKSTKGSALANSDNAVMVFGSDVQLGTYPVMVVGYNKTHARICEIQASYNAGASMFWDIGNVGNDNGTSQLVIEGNEFDNYIVDLSKGSWTGAASDPQGWDNHKDNSLNNFWVRFVGHNEIPAPGEHFDLAYVAFFQDVDAAKDFANANAADALEPVLVNIDGKNTSVPAGYSVKLPEAKVKSFKDFSHYEDEDGNVYQAGDEVVATTNKTITAVYTDAADFRVTYYDGANELATFTLPAGTALDHIENVGEMQAPDGQDFTGWFYEGSQWEIVDGYALDRDMDLVASYDMTYRYVTYIVDGAVWGVEEYTRGEGILLPELTADEIGERTFLDWKTAEGNCTIANGEKVYTNLVLEADFYEAERTSESAPLTVLIGVMKKIKEHQGKPTMATGKRPYALFDGKELAISSGINGIEGSLQDGYYRFELRADTTMKDGSVMQIRFLSDTPITFNETPVMVVGYRTNYDGDVMDGDMCWYDENMAIARAWGGGSGVNKAPTMVADEKWQKAIINMENRRYTGGDGKMAGKTMDQMEELGMSMQFAGFNRRFGSIGTTAPKGAYFDIQYIAFFKSVEDAGSFTYAEGILDELEIKAQREAEKAAAAEAAQETVEEVVEETVEEIAVDEVE